MRWQFPLLWKEGNFEICLQITSYVSSPCVCSDLSGMLRTCISRKCQWTWLSMVHFVFLWRTTHVHQRWLFLVFFPPIISQSSLFYEDCYNLLWNMNAFWMMSVGQTGTYNNLWILSKLIVQWPFWGLLRVCVGGLFTYILYYLNIELCYLRISRPKTYSYR